VWALQQQLVCPLLQAPCWRVSQLALAWLVPPWPLLWWRAGVQASQQRLAGQQLQALLLLLVVCPLLQAPWWQVMQLALS
jgi:hypothetical protein